MQLRIPTKKKLELLRSLSTMITAGIPLYEGVVSLLNQATGNEKVFLKIFKDNLNQGKTISETFSLFPLIFDDVTISTIKIAEETGTLDVTFKDITDNIQKKIIFESNLKSTLVYPIVVVGVFFVVLIGILVFIIPKIAEVFYSLHVVIPLSAQLLIGLSNFVIDYALLLIVIFIAIVAFIVYLVRYKLSLVLNFFFSLPIISKLGVEIDLANLSRNLHLLLSAGVSINRALKLCKEGLIQTRVIDVLNKVELDVSAGKDLSTSLKSTSGVIPDFMILAISTGERTGTLSDSMKIVSEYFENQVDNTVKRLASLIEPVIIIIIGIMIGGMMISIITPIYQLIGNIKS